MKEETLGRLLGGKSYGIFKNTIGEYCTISSYYIRNTRNFKIIFSKGYETATRNAISTVSEKKVMKLIKDEGFVLDETLN